MTTPDWDDLRFFLALCESGTLTGAARALAVEHTTVARRIDALEAALDVRLFDRFPKGWSATATGLELLPAARKMEDDMHALMRLASGTPTLTGVVRVSAPPALAAHLLARGLPGLLRALPGIELDVRGEARTTDLTRREADIALRFARPAAPGLAVRRLVDIDYALCASAGYLAGRDQAQWEFLAYDEQMADTPQQAWLDKLRGTRSVCLRSNDLSVLWQAARAGAGVAVLPRYLAEDLVCIDSHPCPVRRKLWMVMHEDVRRSARVRAVADAIAAVLS